VGLFVIAFQADHLPMAHYDCLRAAVIRPRRRFAQFRIDASGIAARSKFRPSSTAARRKKI